MRTQTEPWMRTQKEPCNGECGLIKGPPPTSPPPGNISTGFGQTFFHWYVSSKMPPEKGHRYPKKKLPPPSSSPKKQDLDSPFLKKEGSWILFSKNRILATPFLQKKDSSYSFSLKKGSCSLRPSQLGNRYVSFGGSLEPDRGAIVFIDMSPCSFYWSALAINSLR